MKSERSLYTENISRVAYKRTSDKVLVSIMPMLHVSTEVGYFNLFVSG